MAAFSEHVHGSSMAWVWLWLLAAVFGWSLLRQGVRPFLERLFESPANIDPDDDGDGGRVSRVRHGGGP